MIHISSKLGKGTSFCIYLPLTEELSAEQAAVRTDEPACGQGHILVVDDEEDVRAGTPIALPAVRPTVGHLPKMSFVAVPHCKIVSG